MNDDEFLAAFENCTLPPDLWTHRAHVRVAYLYASRNSLYDATDRIRTSIRAYAKARNTPEAIDSGYHETVTAAFMVLVFAANLQTGPYETSQHFCEAHPELLNSHALRKFYSRNHIKTWEAKADFIDPDLCSLPDITRYAPTINNLMRDD